MSDQHAHGGHGEVQVEDSSLSNTGILVFCLITAGVFFGSILFLPGLFYRYVDHVQHQRASAGATDEQTQLRALEEKRLTSYGYVEQAKQVVHIPIEIAKQKVIEEAKR